MSGKTNGENISILFVSVRKVGRVRYLSRYKRMFLESFKKLSSLRLIYFSVLDPDPL